MNTKDMNSNLKPKFEKRRKEKRKYKRKRENKKVGRPALGPFLLSTWPTSSTAPPT
jgi:hypothetical protein